jgi:hypothetical protein
MPEAWRTAKVVTFCTGGIRCEKAAPFMERAGFREVYQLEGGILKYFEEVGGDHYARLAVQPWDVMRATMTRAEFQAFLRGNVSHQRRLRLWFSAEWMPNIFTDLRVGYTNRNGGNTPEDFFFGSLELRVGY